MLIKRLSGWHVDIAVKDYLDYVNRHERIQPNSGQHHFKGLGPRLYKSRQNKLNSKYECVNPLCI